MPTNPKSMTDRDIEELKKEEMKRGTYPTEAEELGGEEGEEHIIIERDIRPFSERMQELEEIMEVYEAMLGEDKKDEGELRTRSGNILQKYHDIKRDLDELVKEDSESEKGVAQEFQERLKNIELKMESLGI